MASSALDDRVPVACGDVRGAAGAPGPYRTAVRQACVRASVSLADAESSFLAVMAWGYGRVGYGPFRVRRVLDAAPNAGVQLQAAAGAAAEGRPVEAYACLGDHGAARLPYLGPAFGTKFLYFCSSTGRRSALILDRLVARWLRENVGLAFNEVRWSVSTYTRYLATMVGWAGVLARAADQLEVCIFSAQARLGDTQWAFS
jgi:8-oxoguanine DNA glycosylase-like protein